MTDRWNIRIVIYPHSTGHGSVNDQEACGGREYDVTVPGRDAEEAIAVGRLIAKAIEFNPRVWQAFVVKLEAA